MSRVLSFVRRAELVLVLVLYQAIVAFVIAWPISSCVRAVYGRSLDGDAPLWNEGGLELLDFLLHVKSAWSPIITGSLVTLTVGALLGVAPLAVVIRSLGDLHGASGTWKPFRARLARSVEAWSTLLFLWLAYAVFAALVVFLAWGMAHLATRAADGSGPVRSQELGWVAGGLSLLLFVPLNVLHDAMQTAAVIQGRKFFGAVVFGARRFAEEPWARLFAWSWRAAVGAIAIGIGAALSDRLGGLGGSALTTLLVGHQLVVIVRATVRVSWLGTLVDD